MHLEVNCFPRFRVRPLWHFSRQMSLHWHWGGASRRVGGEAAHFPLDGTLHFHVTCVAPIKVVWGISAPLTFNGYNFWVLHYDASRSNLDSNLVFSLSLERVRDASLQGYNGLDFKRKNTENFTGRKICILSTEYRILSTWSPWHTV